MNKVLKLFLSVTTMFVVLSMNAGSIYAADGGSSDGYAGTSDVSNYTLTITRNLSGANRWVANIKGNLPKTICYKPTMTIVGDDKGLVPELLSAQESEMNASDQASSADTGSVIIRLILVQTTSASCQKTVDLTKDFNTDFGKNISFRVLEFSEATRTSVPLTTGAKYKSNVDGLSLVSTYNKDGQWNYQVTGKISKCYDIKVEPGINKASLPKDTPVTSDTSLGNSAKRYFEGSYYITLTPNSKKDNCALRNKWVNVKGSITVPTPSTVKFQSRIRQIADGKLNKNKINLKVTWVNNGLEKLVQCSSGGTCAE